ncbi:toxic anion resistance protein [Selenomonas sputigena]|uniref:Toxic anion resistance family protein n=1 Tax=Selenomonas sputigena (strain ATCC 35185 / DSM 20758 / CCUG 44933 / VPI D19B-28) TaxID=546271 RepID=C9LRY1_SELS3|nr:toxic anion resistance protein [Selenomonas sputigena]AEB99973.1 toxic anion resistance family protein [Selenomonas sputigena ATCC 35185]EEX78399.1 toxic anion resistance protein TelA [Selenomonas sputigena ATCC 35185]
MAEINLEDLLSKRAQQPQEKALELAPEKELERIAQAVEELTPAERAEVEKIKEGLDLTDSAAIIDFGTAAQKNIADFSDSILCNVRAKDSGYVGELLGELLTNVKSFEPKSSDGGFLKKLPLVSSLVGKAETMMQGYEKVSVQVEKVKTSLQKARMLMMKDVTMLDTLFAKNLEYFKTLELYIRAGEEKMQEMREVTLPKLRAQAAASSDPMAAQVVSDFESSVERFEKKVHDLKISKTISIQTAPQIRLIQNNDKVLIDRVQSAIYNSIPLWKNQMVIALGLANQKKVLEMQHSVNEMTNDLLKKNAEMLKIGTIETAKENERSIVDIETVRKVNDDLVTTIEETLKIQQEGRAKRRAAEAELVELEGRLKKALESTLDGRSG